MLVVALSGPVASGKSALANEFVKRFAAYRLSTRELGLGVSLGQRSYESEKSRIPVHRHKSRVWHGMLLTSSSEEGRQ